MASKQNPSILITGCSSGIGLCAAKTLAQRGYRVFATARRPEAVQMLQQQGFESILLDVNDSASIQAGVREILSRTNGTLDALLNNAGNGHMGAVEDLSRNILRAQFETNVFGLIELSNAVIPVMRRQGHGRIIQISSVLGIVSLPFRGAYNASKFAVEAFTDALRLELHGSNIYVSLIEPGPIKSEFRSNALQISQDELDVEHSVHRAIYEKMRSNNADVKNEDPFTLPPDAVVEKIIHALESSKPKIRYFVTTPTYFLTTLKRLLPSRWMDWLVWQMTKQEMK